MTARPFAVTGTGRSSHRARRGRRAVAGAVAAALLLVAAVLTALTLDSSGPDTGPTDPVVAGSDGSGPLDPAVAERLGLILDRTRDGSPVPAGPTAEGSAPRRVLIPALGVDAGVVPVDAPDRALLPPSDPDLLGWWAEGAAPGARLGSSLITGHSVHTGGGALQDIGSLSAGDEVVVETSAGPVEYAVSDTLVLDKPSLARRAPELFDQGATGRVVLITCEDWNGSEWLSNTVVTAEPVRAGRASTA